jgi:alanine dehydrogenase
MQKKLSVNVEPVAGPREAVKGADIVAMTTDSLVPVIKAEWLEPGMHVTNVRNNEIGPDLIQRADVIARLGTSSLNMDHPPPGTINGSDGMFGYFAGTEEEKRKVPVAPSRSIDNPNIGTIPDIMAGRWRGRTDSKQITLINNQGTQGLQFAAVGGKTYELAQAKGLGHPLPPEWFVQNIRD